MSKTRSDAVLLNLPEEQQAKLAEWLLSGVPYHEARLLVEKEFGVALRSLSPFSSFWTEVCQPHLLLKRRRAAAGAEARAEEAEKHPAKFNTATLDAIQQKAYELAENPNANPKDVKAILMLLLKSKDQDLKAQQLGLDREKFQRETCAHFVEKWAANEKVKALMNSGSTNAEKIEQLGALMFGEDWR